jgi:cyclopropane-fatty-acyl-phospholipid synthase
MAGALEKLIGSLGAASHECFRVRFADGGEWQSRDGNPLFTISFNTPAAERRTLLFGHTGLLESYFDGSAEVEGDFPAAFRVGMQTRFDRRSNRLVWARNQWHELTRSNRTIAQAKVNARFHYGLGADFYRHWLDQDLMMYTCAYWKEGTHTVEEAQRNKVEHVCRKLRLQPGESVVDIGTGFGGFLLHAVEHHGIHGSALNTTTEQVQWLKSEVARRGLAERIRVREADFREVDQEYDKVVSIGVLEHAGRDQLAEVIRAHADFLKPGGLGMLHFIGHVGARDTEYYIRKYVFPGGWIPSLAETISEMERCGLEIVDIENLRRHYAPTLDAWAERFDQNWERIHALDALKFDERFRRIWRTYLISCAEMFRSPAGRTHLFQIVFSKGNTTASSYPMSRHFLYG